MIPAFSCRATSKYNYSLHDWDIFLAGNPCQFTSLGIQAETFPSDRVPTAMLVRDTGVIRWLCCQFQQFFIRAASAPWTAPQSNATQGQSTDEALLFWIQPPSHSSPTHSTVLMKWSDHLKALSFIYIYFLFFFQKWHYSCCSYCGHNTKQWFTEVHKKIKVAIVSVWFHTKVKKCNCLCVDIWIYLLELLIIHWWPVHLCF